MLSQNTLVWVGGAAASTVAAAGAVAGALLWTHPGFLWPGPAATQVVASAPELRGLSVPPPVPAAAPVATAAAPDATQEPAASPLKPAFDAVNVDPTGEAVIAGRAAPNAKVELRDAGKTIAEGTADASGQFVIIPPALTPGDHSLSLAAEAAEATAETSSVVAVTVPQPEVKGASASPAPLAPAAAPAPSPAMRALAAPAAASRVAIHSVEADAAGGLVAKGSAGPNATVRFYLNGSNVAAARTQSDGRWSLTIKRGMTAGGYMMRADEVNPGDASVVASADTPFDYPAGPAPTATSAPPSVLSAPTGAAVASAGLPPPAADVVVDTVQTALVRPGHTLWALSQNYYGDPTRYPVIYEANKWEIHNPNLIYPGEVFVVPKFEPKP
jgi:nucleoid-associated protein YgaU